MNKLITSLSAVLSLCAQANPSDLYITKFADYKITPSPACIAAATTGEVFVGVDLIGDLGKGAGMGRIIRLIDTDHDGKADSHTVFAEIDNPRGLIPMGDKLYVIHTVIPKDTGILTGMYLSVLEDKNNDGIADGPPKILVRDISVAKHNQDRGADHTTNGMRMGIDGWLYIAVGDFGIVDAKGSDGKMHTQLGGGVLRVRPDGSEMELYTHGLRNIYDVAIDPFMNIFTRGNTNDGGGWNIRFIHHLQTAEYGYPTLFKNFTADILPALEDLGGGSGTGSYFMDEPTWPEKYNKQPMMADWGRSQIFIHRLTPDGASYTQNPENFIAVPQPTDLDVDGSGRLYISAWQGAGYKGNPKRGFIQRAVPKGWTYKEFPDFTKLQTDALVIRLNTASATARITAQQEILRRDDKSVATTILAIAKDANNSLASRVAAIFTYKQLLGAEANPALVELSSNEALTEFTLRALTDRLTQLDGLTPEIFQQALQHKNPRVQAVAIVSLGRLGNKDAAESLLAISNPPITTTKATKSKEGPHATPNSTIIIPHLAVQSLVRLKAVDACLASIQGNNSEGALWALRHMHDPAVVDGLIQKYATVADDALKHKILATLSRLYTMEAPYDGSWWWNTKPDTRGPYYKPITWEKSPAIEKLFRDTFAAADVDGKARITTLANLHRMNLKGVGKVEKIKAKKIQTVGKMSIENVMLGLDKYKGNPQKGMRLMKTQACLACHSISKTDPKRGPDLNHIGASLNREAIAEAILKPDAGIAESWVDITKNDGTIIQGTLVGKNASEVIIRDIAGVSTTMNARDVKEIKSSASTLMGPHLMDALTMPQFADIIAYLHSLK